MITYADTLANYKVGCRTRIIADASPVGLGGRSSRMRRETYQMWKGGTPKQGKRPCR